MKITDVKLNIVERPGRAGPPIPQLVPMPGLRRTQYHRSQDERHSYVSGGPVYTTGPAYEMVLRVQTDEGVEGLCTGGNSDVPLLPAHVELLRANVIGDDPLDREHLFQKLYTPHLLHQPPGWFGAFDNCLWDIAGKVAGLPVCKLVGRVRDSIPVYQTGSGGPVEMYIEHIEEGLKRGIRAYKPHSYKGGKADIPIVRKLREYVGPDYALMLDPVCSYTLAEAIEVGHVLEELDFVWFEEPMHEYRMNLYQELCAELTIPVMGTETLVKDMHLSAQWLINGATDRLRGNANYGTTQVLKMAHFAELHGTNIELAGGGALYGLVHAHLECCIANTDFYEGGVGARPEPALEIGMLNPPQVVDGHIAPPDGPGWGAEWDMEVLKRRTVQEL